MNACWTAVKGAVRLAITSSRGLPHACRQCRTLQASRLTRTPPKFVPPTTTAAPNTDLSPFRHQPPVSFSSRSEGTMKIDSLEFHGLFTPELRQLAELFKKYGFELRIAGGAVRDLLMKKQPQDVDFATTATPEQMKEMFTQEGIRMINSKGEKHGTITARLNDRENFEVTTLRIDRVTDGRHAEVEFTTDWKTDAERRDLTINSMFLGLDGTLHDFFSGREDLERRYVAFVGDPATRIQEDYLRILRYFRFYGRIAEESNAHTPATLNAIRENAAGLGGISGERIWMELKKILTGNFAADLVSCMYDLGLARYMGLPCDADLRELHRVCQRSHPLHPHPITLLSALFKGESDVLVMEQRLKISAEERKTALFVVAERGEKPQPRNPLKPYQDIVVCSKEKNIIKYVSEVLKYQGEGQMLSDFRAWDIPRFPITGKDLLGAGVPKGKGFGAVMDRVRGWWMDSDFTANREELLERLKETEEESSQEKS